MTKKVKRIIAAAVILAAAVTAVSARNYVSKKSKHNGNTIEAAGDDSVTISENAVLREIDWTQSHMCYNECFNLQLNKTETGYTISGWCVLPDMEEAEFSSAPITAAQWQEAEKHIQGREFTPYKPPSPYVMDATHSKLKIAWSENGDIKYNYFNGEHEGGLIDVLRKIAEETARTLWDESENDDELIHGVFKPADDESEPWICKCGYTASGKFCTECGEIKPTESDEWICECGNANKSKFCTECGSPKP